MKKVLDVLVAIVGGILYVPGTLMVVIFFLAFCTDVLEVESILRFMPLLLSFPVAIACFCYLSKGISLKVVIPIATFFPFLMLGIFVLIVSVLEFLNIGGGKAPIIFAMPPTLILSLITMYLAGLKLNAKIA